MELTQELASKFAHIALGHVTREYPNSLQQVLGSDADASTPRELHPAFYGSYDWHSCVHSWWMLLTLRNEWATLPEAREIEALADATFTEAKMAAELAYFQRPTSRGFERPYGWAWFLYLHREAAQHPDKDWGARLEPLARHIALRLREYLKVLTYPITVGTHYNTAFALTLASEWAWRFDQDLAMRIADWSNAKFTDRTDYRGWEPGGDEFLSPVLTVANLMALTMPDDDDALFDDWFDRLIVTNGWLERECRPVTVSDRSDGKIAHLDGLNLSRAWCLWRLALARGDPTPVGALLHERAEQHLAASLPYIAGEYEGEHWLASFALLALRYKP